MRRQIFVFTVLLAFAFCTTAQPVCGTDKGMPEGDKSETRHARVQKEKDRVTKADKTMRFRGLDRNNDGRITRNEWRGNDVSFRVHDWNRDGVLSGIEVRPGATRR